MKSDEIYFFILWITSLEEDNRVYGCLPHFFLMECIHIQGLITRIFDGLKHFFPFFNHVYRQLSTVKLTVLKQPLIRILQGFMIYFFQKARTIYAPKI